MGGDIERMKIMEEKMRERRNWRTSLFTSYQGDYVEISLSDKTYRRYKFFSLLLITSIAALHIGGGFINNPGMSEFYVVIPYIAALGSIVYFTLFRFQLPKEKTKFRMGEVNLLFNRLRNACLLLWLCLVAIMVGESIFLQNLATGAQTTADFIFLALTGVEMITAFFLMMKQIQIGRGIKVI